MTKRRCLDCQRFTDFGSRCDGCRKDRKRIRNADRPIAAAVVAASPICEWCGDTEDLTADHIIPLSRGGTNEGPRRVLCRSCNSGRRNRG